MSITNGLVLPNSFVNGQVADATQVMADFNYLLAALNRALLDSGAGAGMNAQATQIHNLANGSAVGDAVNLGQLQQYLPLAGGTMTGAIVTDTAATGLEALIIPHGVAPTTPTNGSVWTTTAGLFARINGVTFQYASIAGAETLTNKRVSPRVGSVASGATITPTSDTADQYEVTALAVAATVAAPSGTPTDGQRLLLRLKDNGGSQTLTWTVTSGGYRALAGISLPAATTAGKQTYVGCIYNAADSFWDVVAVMSQP